MAIFAELFALSRTYPLISIILATILFFVGLRVAGKLLKWFFWILAIVAIIFAVVLFFK